MNHLKIDSAVYFTSEILKEIDARTGSSTYKIQQKAIDITCLFVDCSESDILFYKIPEIVTFFRTFNEFIGFYVDEQCVVDFGFLIRELENLNFDAIKVLDSWGKIPSGILDGNLKAWGRSDLCLSTQIKDSIHFIYF
jgi:hypothetical protein